MSRLSRASLVCISLVAVGTLFVALLAHAGGRRDGDGNGGALGNPGVYPPGSSPFGKSYGEWSAEHWKWLLSIPYATNPANDFSGANCDEGQSGQVWFLSGSFCPEPPTPCSNFTVTRECTVPAGKALFFPILDSECSTLEGNGTTDAELRACAKSFQDLGTGMTCEVDGVPIGKLQSYRVQSPLFTYGPLPEGNIFQVFGLDAPAGSTSPSVSDGVFLMLVPPSAGPHTIHFTGSIPDFGFGMDITYHLTVGGTSASATSPAGTTPAVRATWGRLKTIYR